MLTDLRLALRQLLKTPGFTLTAVITLSLGLGASTAIFSLLHTVLLKPLPYRAPEQLVTVMQRDSAESPADFHAIQTSAQSFSGVAAAQGGSAILTGLDRPEHIPAILFSPEMFTVLGVPAQLGRAFDARDFAEGQPPVAVISHALWQRRFGGQAEVLGRTVTLNGAPHTIIGVMPASFRFAPFWITHSEIWLPLRLDPSNRDNRSLRVFARLKDGVSRTEAQSEMTALAQRLALEHPKSNANRRLDVDSLHERAVGNVRPALLMLGGAVGLVLLIVCANLASLLLVRATGRRRELAVCAALGASRGRLIRRQLAESAWLAAGGALGGTALAYALLGVLTQMLATPAGKFSLPRIHEVTPDLSLLAAGVALAGITTLVFGLLPALQSTRLDLNTALRDGGRGLAGGSGQRTRAALIVAEIAIALVLLGGAGLFLRAFAKLSNVDPGFQPDGALAFTVSVSGRPEYVGAPREQLYRQIIQKLENLPAVEAVGVVNHLPLAGDSWTFRHWAEGAPLPEPGREAHAIFRATWPGYFRALGTRLVAGRDFTERDTASTEGVIIINETLAAQYWPAGDALGQRLSLADPRQNPRWLTVVGVVADMKQDSWTTPSRPEFFRPILQQQDWFFRETHGAFSYLSFVVRARGDATALANAVREAVWSLDRDLPVSQVATLGEIAAAAVAQPRLQLQLVGTFAVVAILLAAIGLYGVLAYSVAQRTTEIGVRLALGAQRHQILRQVLRQGALLAAAGAGLGLVVVFAVGRGVASLLHGISPYDAVALGGATGLLLAIALLATLVPAWRASRVDPLVALRAE